MDWSNRVVLITGASSGIGRGLALELARRGAKLGLVARRRELLDQIVADIQSGDVLAITGDVQDAQSMREAAQQVVSRFGKIDVLVANAGIGATNDGADLDASKV